MGTANRNNITKRSDKSSALTHPELDKNFDELGNVIDDSVNLENGKVSKGEVGSEQIDTATGTQSIPAALNQRVIYVDTIADLQALPASGLVDGQAVRITTTGRAGDFVVKVGDFSTEVTNDPQSGVWVKFDDAPATSIVAMRNTDSLTPGNYGIDDNNPSHDVFQAISHASLVGIPIDLREGTYYQLSAGTTSGKVFSSRGSAKIVCTTSDRIVVDSGEFSISGNITVDFNGGHTEGWLLIDEGVSNLKIDGLRFTNSHSNTFCNFVTISAYGVSNFSVKNLSADNVDVDKDSVQGNQAGSMRLLLVIPQGTPSLQLSNGTIEKVTCRDFGNDEDSDIIHVSNLSESLNHDIVIRDVTTYNVGKRAVKIQANGCTVNNVRSFSDAPSPQFSVVSHFGDGGMVSNIKGVGNITYGAEIISSTHADNIILDSTGGTSVVVTASGSPKLRNITSLGTCKNAVLARPTSGNIETLIIKGVYGVYTENVILLGMDTSGSGNSFTCADIENVFATTTTSSLNIIVASPFGGLNIGEVLIKNYRADYSGTPYFTSIALTCDNAKIENAYNKTSTGSFVSLTGCSRVFLDRVITESGTRVVNLVTCSNTTSSLCEGGSSEVVRIDGGDSHVCTSLITSVGGSSVATVNSPTNVIDNNPIVRT